ncbi:SMP-30/gluconolactonase/LRE family protein [Ginsengibacter hankyongi]|uniref:SMP-30/gluconolactonase/LRE family protein n=1 Tax=Ginsengibacter hankyongi TaxID=2607284 RepID=A0A5J5IDT3_9BACT|nr:SMP-30/gluconolactonase/LRE family protein [Ginsengibacter hankyongi]
MALAVIQLSSQVQFCLSANAQFVLSDTLFKSAEFTPPNSFTHGVEGPAVDKHGNVYAVNFSREGTIGIVHTAGNPGLFIDLPDSSVGNGIRFDTHGNMLIADYTKHNVLKVNMKTKKISVFAHEPKMTQPNDIAIDSKNRVYASDPNFKLNTGRIWRIDGHGSVTLLDTLNGPANGIEVSPDEKKLYVNAGRKVWSYNLSPKGELNNKSLLLEFADFGCDGMRCDTAGNLYIARIGKGVVAKVSPNGDILKEIKLFGKNPTNVAFGGEDGCRVYVTLMDMGNLETFRVDTPGREWRMQRKK